MHTYNIPNLHIILYDGFFACYTSTSMRSGNTYVNLFLHASCFSSLQRNPFRDSWLDRITDWNVALCGEWLRKSLLLLETVMCKINMYMTWCSRIHAFIDFMSLITLQGGNYSVGYQHWGRLCFATPDRRREAEAEEGRGEKSMLLLHAKETQQWFNNPNCSIWRPRLSIPVDLHSF